MKFEFSRFTGMMPRFNDRQLPKGAAIDAQSIDFDHGALKAVKAQSVIASIDANTKTVGKHHGVWLNSTGDVSIVDSIQPQDGSIIYFCGESQVLSMQDVSVNQNLGVGSSELGVPVPRDPYYPSIFQFPIYAIDFDDTPTPSVGDVIVGSFSLSSGFFGASDEVNRVQASIYEGATVFYRGEHVKLVNVVEKELVANGGFTQYAYETAFQNARGEPTPYESGMDMTRYPDSGDSINDEDDIVFNPENSEQFSLAFTNVHNGLESAPLVGYHILNRQKGNSLRVTITDPEFSAYSVRVYEDTGNGFLFVTEIPAGESYGYIKSEPYRTYGAEVTSTLNDEPIDGMHSLISLPNAVLAGAYKNLLCVSRPGLPHAWPALWQVTVEGDIVGLGNLNNAIIVLTERGAWIANAYDPSAINLEATNAEFGCVFRSSIVSHASGVYYAAIDGLWLITGQSAQNVTWQTIDKDSWKALQPETFHAVIDNGYYIARRGALNDLIKINLSDFSYTVEAL